MHFLYPFSKNKLGFVALVTFASLLFCPHGFAMDQTPGNHKRKHVEDGSQPHKKAKLENEKDKADEEPAADADFKDTEEKSHKDQQPDQESSSEAAHDSDSSDDEDTRIKDYLETTSDKVSNLDDYQISDLERRAHQESTEAKSVQNLLGGFYYFKKNFGKAFAYFNGLANDQNFGIRANCMLSIMHYNGEGVPQDFAKALTYYNQMIDPSKRGGVNGSFADTSNIYALLENVSKNQNAGASYVSGMFHLGPCPDVKSNGYAYMDFACAAKLGFPLAQAALKETMDLIRAEDVKDTKGCWSVMYRWKDWQDWTDEHSMVYLKILADTRQYKPAQLKLGICYLTGKGVQKNLTQAKQYLEQVLNNEDKQDQFDECSYAHLYLGLSYDVDKNAVEAEKHYKLAANNRIPKILCHLGQIYEIGQCAVKDIKQAITYYKGAGLENTKNSSKALFQLADIYLNGRPGIQSDLTKAYLYLHAVVQDSDAKPELKNFCTQLANNILVVCKNNARQGDKDAQANLARLYDRISYHGELKYYVERSEKYYKLAADQGHVQAQYRLAKRYEINDNFRDALKYANLAAAHGHEKAKKVLTKCANRAESDEE